MELKSENSRKSAIQSIAIAFFITYGLHYFAFFLRAQYYGLIDSPRLGEGVSHVLMYAGHIYFLVFMGLYALAVEGDRKYLFRAFRGNGESNIAWLLAGALTGFVLMGICIAAAGLHGDISINTAGKSNIGLIIPALFTVFLQASTEELESRAFLFGKMRGEGVPLIPAIAVSSFFFGYIHRANPGFGIIPMLSIFVVGVLYALSYHYFGNLWFTCGAHTLWNFTQDFIFGLPDSGKPPAISVMNTTINGNSFFYDPDFGIEGSWMAICTNLAACVIVILIGRRLKKKRG